MRCIGPAQPGIAGIDLLMDGLQLGGQTVHRQRLEHVADDVVLDGLLGILEIVEAAQKGNVHGRAYLAHLPGQLNARDEGHPNVGQQQIRLKPLDKLKRIQPVAGAAHQMEAQRLPWDHGADGLAQFVLIIGHNDGVDVFISHTLFPLQPELNQTAHIFIQCGVLPPQLGLRRKIDTEVIADTRQHRQRKDRAQRLCQHR